ERESEAGGGSRSAGGDRWCCRLARGRLGALFTDSTVASRMSGTSFAWNPRTSRGVRTGTWGGGNSRKAGAKGGGEGTPRRVGGRRAERHVDHTFEEGVGKWLEPYDFAEPGRLGRFNLGHVPLLGRSSAGRTQHVEAPVGGDPVEPGAKGGASLKPSEALPGG